MTNPGSIYILLNASMPKLLKIGKTTKSPEERAAELSVGTGVPTPYLVAHYVLVDDCDLAEREVHKRLEAYRINDKREFFSVPLRIALKLLSEFESASPDAPPPPLGGHVPKSSTSFPKEENAILALALEFQATAPRWQDSIEDCACLYLAHWLGKPEAQAQLETLRSKMCFSDQTLALSTAIFYRRGGPEAKLFLKAMRCADGHFLSRLGAYFEQAMTITGNYALAARCYLSAAKRGAKPIYYRLAVMYENGVGVSADLERAFAFYFLSTKSGVEEAIKPLGRIRSLYPPDRIAAATRFAEEFEQPSLKPPL